MSLRRRVEALRPKLASAAQRVYDDWEQVDEDEGGICDVVAGALAGVLAAAGIDSTDGGHDGDDHAWVIAYDATEAFAVDIPPGVYETGSGYRWKKKQGVTIEPVDVVVERVERSHLGVEENPPARAVVELQRIVERYMQLLETPGRAPAVFVRRNLGSPWLARWSWRPPGDPVVEVQASALVDARSLERVLAHEACHHHEWATMSQRDRDGVMALARLGIKPVEHSRRFHEIAERVNARAGAGFVTRTCDSGYVTGTTGKSFLVLVTVLPHSTHGWGWQWAARLGPKAKAWVEKKRQDDTARLAEVSDDRWARGPKIEAYAGWALARDAEEARMLRDLWNKAAPRGSTSTNPPPHDPVGWVRANERALVAHVMAGRPGDAGWYTSRCKESRAGHIVKYGPLKTKRMAQLIGSFIENTAMGHGRSEEYSKDQLSYLCAYPEENRLKSVKVTHPAKAIYPAEWAESEWRSGWHAALWYIAKEDGLTEGGTVSPKPGASTNPPPSRIVNRFGGPCCECGKNVPPGAGFARRGSEGTIHSGHWFLRCQPCDAQFDADRRGDWELRDTSQDLERCRRCGHRGPPASMFRISSEKRDGLWWPVMGCRDVDACSARMRSKGR